MMKINDRLHGFRLVKKAEVPEVDSTAYEFFHEKSGARLFFLQNDDDNGRKFFGIKNKYREPEKVDRASEKKHSQQRRPGYFFSENRNRCLCREEKDAPIDQRQYKRKEPAIHSNFWNDANPIK